MASTLPAGRIAAADQRPQGRNESGGTASASHEQPRDLHRAHRVLPDSIDRAPRRHRLGAGPLWLRQQPRGRNREDAIRPVLHQEPIGLARRAHPAAHRRRRLQRRRRQSRANASARADAVPLLVRPPSAGAGTHDVEQGLSVMFPSAAPACLSLPADGSWWRRAEAAPTDTVGQTSTSRVAFWSLVAFTCILLLSPQIWFPVLGTLRIAFLAAGLAIGAHLLQRLADHPPTRIAPAIAIAVALVCWSAITVPVSYWPGGSVEVLTDRYVKAVVFFWLVGTLVTTTSRLRVFAWT